MQKQHSGTELKCFLITGAVEVARHALRAGASRIFVDMEVLGKAERQGHLDTHKAAHTVADVAALRAALADADILVRTNPLHEGSPAEVEAVIAAGASRIMLPMFHCAEDVAQLKSLVAGRVPVTLLVETPQALVRLESYVGLLGEGDEIYFGLNDLSIGMGLDFLFEPLAARLLDRPAALLRERGIPFGFGGIARMGTGELPAEWVLGEHVRLGSQLVILSRAFHGGASCVDDLKRIGFAEAVAQLREHEAAFRQMDAAELERNQARLAERVFDIAARKRRHD